MHKIPRGHCRHFLFIFQDPGGRPPAQELFSALPLQSAVPLRARTALPAILHYSIYL